MIGFPETGAYPFWIILISIQKLLHNCTLLNHLDVCLVTLLQISGKLEIIPGTEMWFFFFFLHNSIPMNSSESSASICSQLK